jgi:hypothetical protein
VTKSGGFAGLRDTVSVRADGTWTRTDRRGAERTGRLSDAQVSRLRTLANDPALAAAPGGGKVGRCSDAFTYDVVAAGHRIRYEDCPGGTRPAEALALADYVLKATNP